ncbi:MAG: large-conductance mechanosensitive channel protein MscL [Fulvivirga sp.]
MKRFYKEFKEFAVKGSVVDLAIGVVIGTAFNKIVSSLVNDVIMPPFGLLWGSKDFANYKWVLKAAEHDANGSLISNEVALNYGAFGAHVLDFIIIAFSIFIVLKFINSLRRKAEDEEETSVPTPKDIQLLVEIRDLLKKDKH